MQQVLTNADGTPLALKYPLDPNDTNQMLDLRKGITVFDSANDSFGITMEYKDASDAQKICNAIITTFINQSAQEKSAYFSADVAFIQQEVDSYRQKLTDSETALTNFKAQNAGNLPTEQDAIEQQMVEYQSQEQDLQIQQAEDQMRAQYIEQQMAQVPPKIITAQTSSDSPLVTQLKNLEFELTSDIAVKQMKPNHPEVIALQQQIDRLKLVIDSKAKSGDADYQGAMSTDTEPNPLYQSLQGQLVQVQIDQKALQAKQAITAQLLAKATTGAALVPGAERTMSNLQRDYASYSNSYDSLMGRLQEAQINEQLNLRQAQSAYTVMLTSPFLPSTGLGKECDMLAGGVVLAILIGCSLVLICEFLDRSLRDPLDAQRLLNLPVLAVLPEAKVLHSGEVPNRPLLDNRADDLQRSQKALASS